MLSMDAPPYSTWDLRWISLETAEIPCALLQPLPGAGRT